MKKITYLLLILIGMVFYCSCSNEDISKETVPTSEISVNNPETQALIDFQTRNALIVANASYQLWESSEK